MVNEILNKTGLPFKESRFLSPPKSTYAIYNLELDRRGGDDINLVSQYDATIELYEYAPDPGAEKTLEEILDSYGVEFSKDSRYWIDSEQLYQVIYNFSYIKKGGL